MTNEQNDNYVNMINDFAILYR